MQGCFLDFTDGELKREIGNAIDIFHLCYTYSLHFLALYVSKISCISNRSHEKTIEFQSLSVSVSILLFNRQNANFSYFEVTTT